MFGKVLSKEDLIDEKLQSKLTALYEQDKFKQLVSKMQKTKKFKPEELVVEKAYKFVAAVGQEDRGIIQFDATIINLVSKDETINILYNEIPIFQDYYFGKILQKGKIITFEFEQDEIIKEQNETDLEKFQFTKEDIVVSDDEADRIGTQAWWTADGCLPGGYQHCGGNCGYGLDHGGGSPINSTDVCCIAHDRCYSVFGDGDNCCDKELVSCVSGHDTWAAVGIRAFFGPQALFCSY